MVSRCCFWFGWSVFGECRWVNRLCRIPHMQLYIVGAILSGTQHLEFQPDDRPKGPWGRCATRLVF